MEVSELRRAGRTLVRSGGYATAAIATLALGLAAAVTIFGVVRSVILQPLPDPDSERIVRINHSAPGIRAPRGLQTTQGMIAFYQDRVRTLSTIAAWFVQDANLSDDGAPEQIQPALTTWQLCDALAIRPMLHRFFTADDDAVPGDAAVVLTHRLWSGADPVLRLLRQSCARHAQTAHGSAPPSPHRSRPRCRWRSGRRADAGRSSCGRSLRSIHCGARRLESVVRGPRCGAVALSAGRCPLGARAFVPVRASAHHLPRRCRRCVLRHRDSGTHNFRPRYPARRNEGVRSRAIEIPVPWTGRGTALATPGFALGLITVMLSDYRHTQIGRVVIIAMFLAAVRALTLAAIQPHRIGIVIFVVALALLALFATLKVDLSDGVLYLSFGVGLI